MVVLLRSCLPWPGWASGFLGIALVTVAYPGSAPFRTGASWATWALPSLACLIGATWLAAALGAPALNGTKGSILPVALHQLPVSRWKIALWLAAGWALVSFVIMVLTLGVVLALPWSEPIPAASLSLGQAAAAIGTAWILQVTLFAGVTLLQGWVGAWSALVVSLAILGASWVLSDAGLQGNTGVGFWAPGALLPITPLATTTTAAQMTAPLVHAAAWCAISMLLLAHVTRRPDAKEAP